MGNFENNGDKIPQWIKANGGKYTKDITAEVTHLITTKEAYKKNVEAGNLSPLYNDSKRRSTDMLSSARGQTGEISQDCHLRLVGGFTSVEESQAEERGALSFEYCLQG